MNRTISGTPGEWVEVVQGDPQTYPRAFQRIEIEAQPGAICIGRPEYVHAFGRRTGIQHVNLPLLGLDLKLEYVLRWRTVPW